MAALQSNTQYRAHIQLVPHSPSPQKSTTVPGEFPVTHPINRDVPKDFSRELVLTPEKPSQPIGRSSSNKNKGLIAARNNAFFDSPVMSRSHAEVVMILEPVRKVVIKDTNSMHGTFVNGLQLSRDETAELQDGTELTFGADVTRSDELHPARTFRCSVSWEEKIEAPQKVLETPKKLTGYGVSGDELILSEMSGDEEEDYDMFDGDRDTASDEEHPSSSSGIASSPPTSPSIGFKNYPISVSDAVERASKPEVICIDDEDPKRETPRAKMPSIPSLVNRTAVQPPTYNSRSEQQDKFRDSEVIVVDDDNRLGSGNPAHQAGSHNGDASQPICVDEDDDNEDQDAESDYEAPDHSCDSDVSMSEVERSDDDDDMNQDDVEELFDEFNEMDDEENIEGKEREKEKAREPIATTSNAPPPQNTDASPQPNNMSSKSGNYFWQGNPFQQLVNSSPYFPRPIIHEALPSLERYGSVHRQHSYAAWDPTPRPYLPPSTHNASQPLPHLMSQKKEFFEARMANMSEAQRAQDQQNTVPWASPTSSRPWDSSPSYPTLEKMDESTLDHPIVAEAQKEDEVSVGKIGKEKPYETVESAGPCVVSDMICPATQAEKQTEDEIRQLEPSIEVEPIPETMVELMNEREPAEESTWPVEPKLPAPHAADSASTMDEGTELVSESNGAPQFPAIPPPSEKEVVHEETKIAPEATVMCRKRKLERMVHVEVPVNGDDFQREDYENVAGMADRPARQFKRARTARNDRGSNRVVGYAASFLGGLVLGGASIFAALVATASE